MKEDAIAMYSIKEIDADDQQDKTQACRVAYEQCQGTMEECDAELRTCL